MINFPPQLIVWVNIPANVIGNFIFSPIRMMPGWLSNTIISAITGVFLLLVFKYTSNQRAIGKVKDCIKADMLSIKLFKDSLSVVLSAQAGAVTGGGEAPVLFHCSASGHDVAGGRATCPDGALVSGSAAFAR